MTRARIERIVVDALLQGIAKHRALQLNRPRVLSPVKVSSMRSTLAPLTWFMSLICFVLNLRSFSG